MRQSVIVLTFILSFICLVSNTLESFGKFLYFTIFKTHSVKLITPMHNNYPQIAVLGCDSTKANLYYDLERKLWVEHLVSTCVQSEQDILAFCKKVKFIH